MLLNCVSRESVHLHNSTAHHVRIPGLEWLQPAEVQREDRAAQPETGRGDAGLRAANDGSHSLKGKSVIKFAIFIEFWSGGAHWIRNLLVSFKLKLNDILYTVCRNTSGWKLSNQ